MSSIGFPAFYNYNNPHQNNELRGYVPGGRAGLVTLQRALDAEARSEWTEAARHYNDIGYAVDAQRCSASASCSSEKSK